MSLARISLDMSIVSIPSFDEPFSCSSQLQHLSSLISVPSRPVAQSTTSPDAARTFKHRVHWQHGLREAQSGGCCAKCDHATHSINTAGHGFSDGRDIRSILAAAGPSPAGHLPCIGHAAVTLRPSGPCEGSGRLGLVDCDGGGRVAEPWGA